MKTTLPIMVLAGLLSTGLPAAAPSSRFSITHSPSTLTISPTVQIVMRLRNLPATFHLAMVKHFLTDDRYWRYVEDLQIAPGTIAREQDGLWRVSGAGSDTTIRYKVRLEDKGASRVVRKPFLTPTGGLFGDLHMFMYVVEASQAPAHVLLQLPPDWTNRDRTDAHLPIRTSSMRATLRISLTRRSLPASCASGVSRSTRPPSAWPIGLVPMPRRLTRKAMVDGMQRITQAAVNLFGGLPWREYLFQVRDGADEEGIEHFDCVTLGLPSAALAEDPHADEDTIAHEFFHTWNMMRIHSAEYTGPDYKPVQHSDLWFSEGFTMFYADLLVRRAGLPGPEPTRTAHLERPDERDYLEQSDNARFSAEQASRMASIATSRANPDQTYGCRASCSAPCST
jgi:hypothetical protein